VPAKAGLVRMALTALEPKLLQSGRNRQDTLAQRGERIKPLQFGIDKAGMDASRPHPK